MWKKQVKIFNYLAIALIREQYEILSLRYTIIIIFALNR